MLSCRISPNYSWKQLEPRESLIFISKWRRSGRTILFITHDVEEAVFLSTSVLAVESAPIHRLTEVSVPLERDRTRQDLAKPEIIALRESLLDNLRKQVIP